MARTLLAADADKVVRKKLQDAQELVAETVQHTRDIMAELEPPLLWDRGLAPALDEYAASLNRRVAQRIHVRNEAGQLPLPSIVKAAFFRIAREAVNNAVKHARAQRIEVTLDGTAERAVLLIVDDGMGFEAAHPRPGCRGISAMRDRALAVGAVLRIVATPGKGTRVRISWQPQS
jgi:signal transduction histidine kinase